MFSKNCKIKQNRLIETLMSQLLNIEIMDLHTRLLHIEKDIEKIKNTLENTVRKITISLFLDYYTVTCGSIPHASSVIYVKPRFSIRSIENIHHWAASAVRGKQNRSKRPGNRKLQDRHQRSSVLTKSTCSRSLPAINYGRGRPRIEGIKCDASSVEEITRLASHGEPMKDA